VMEAGGHAAFLDNGGTYDARRHVGPLLHATSRIAWDGAASTLRD